MKIVTVNVPESYIEACKKLTGEDGLYPSRSELIRHAVHDLLKKELAMLRKREQLEPLKNGMSKLEAEEINGGADSVAIPLEDDYKVYKIVKRLEY